MTAEEARSITKAALVNFTTITKIDKEIEKAAKDGKYEAKYFFIDSYGYGKKISRVEYNALCDRYERVGFCVHRGVVTNENEKIELSWYADPKLEDNVAGTISKSNVD